MTDRAQAVLGVALIVVGGVLATFFADTEIAWFRGRPLGTILLVLGVLDLLQSITRRRKRAARE